MNIQLPQKSGLTSDARLARLLVFVSAVFITLAMPQATLAQSSDFSFGISPLLVELNASPGTVQYFDIEVDNRSRTNSATFNVRVVSIRENPSGGFEFSYDLDQPYSAASWIQLSTDEITMGPGEGRRIIGQITVPRDARGGRYAAVVLELQPEEKQDEEANAAAVFRYRMATIIELSVGSRFNRLAHISALEVLTGEDLPTMGRQFGPNSLLIYASLTNESDIHVIGRGRLIIRNQNGRKVREIPLGTGRGVVLPESTVNFSSVLPSGLPPGTYTLQAVLNYGGLRPAIANRTFTIDQDVLFADQFSGGPALRFNVAPDEIALQIPTGARRVESITLQNHDDVPIMITGGAQPLMYDDQGELDVISMDESSEEFPWLQLNPAEIILQPGQRRNVRVVIENKDDFQGTRYAHLAFDAVQVDPRNRVKVEGSLEGRIGAVVELSSLEGHVRDAEITDLRVNIEPSMPVRFEVDVVNTGNVHFQGTGIMTLARFVLPESIEGVEFIGTGSFEPISQAALPADVLQKVLPGENRLIVGNLGDQLEPGLYQVTVEIGQGSQLLAMAQKEFQIAESDSHSEPISDHLSE